MYRSIDWDQTKRKRRRINHWEKNCNWKNEMKSLKHVYELKSTKLSFILNHLALTFTSTATGDSSWPCLMIAWVLYCACINCENFPGLKRKKKTNSVKVCKKRRTNPQISYHMELIFYQGGRCYCCNISETESDLILFYCNNRDSRCTWPQSLFQQILKLHHPSIDR